MTERHRPRKPRARLVFWSSVLLFVVLFAVVTYRYAAEQPAPSTARAVHVRKVIQRRVVTTVVPSPGQNTVSSAPAESSAYSAPEPVVTSSS